MRSLSNQQRQFNYTENDPQHHTSYSKNPSIGYVYSVQNQVEYVNHINQAKANLTESMLQLSNQQKRLNYTRNDPQHQTSYSKNPVIGCVYSNHNQVEYINYIDQATYLTANANELMLQLPHNQTKQYRNEQFFCNEADPSYYNSINDTYTESSMSDQYYKLLLYREKLMFKLNEINYDTAIFRFSFSSCKTNLTAEQIKYYMATYEFVLKLREWHQREIKHVNEKLCRLYFCNNGYQVARFNQIIDRIKIKTKKENRYTSILSTSTSISPSFATMPKNSYIMATKPKCSVKQKSSYRLCHLPNLKPALNNGKIAEYSCPKSNCFEFYEYENKENSKKYLSLCKKRWNSNKEKDRKISSPKISTRCSDFAKLKNENLINETCSSLIASNNLKNVKSPAVNESLSDKDIELSFNNALDNSFYNSFSGDESIGELVIDENYYH
ncbi:uncharacterized protein LOC105846281 isoform X1 [Hydra vulgaris]|uniref:uncharacterized protein LOC105846281 isoform X1 n=1 Tax=Hydra vulgaris TaxID=6087 RepID=UPI001F5EF774|nr:uncharacterized protein LOC105846281 [Hydra vulgaris]XP_047129949.1 uncharacterized protein LOC105846281 [Hydra vulgaris]